MHCLFQKGMKAICLSSEWVKHSPALKDTPLQRVQWNTMRLRAEINGEYCIFFSVDGKMNLAPPFHCKHQPGKWSVQCVGHIISDFQLTGRRRESIANSMKSRNFSFHMFVWRAGVESATSASAWLYEEQEQSLGVEGLQRSRKSPRRCAVASSKPWPCAIQKVTEASYVPLFRIASVTSSKTVMINKVTSARTGGSNSLCSRSHLALKRVSFGFLASWSRIFFWNPP